MTWGRGTIAATLVGACALGAAARAATPTEHKVSMAYSSYSPAVIAAKVGDSLVFENDDDANHAVFVPTVGFGVDLGAQKPKETRSLVLRRVGTFEVECVNHPSMLARVTVTQ